MDDEEKADLIAMGGLPTCPFCGGKHGSKESANACTDKRRKRFRELDAAMSKIQSKSK